MATSTPRVAVACSGGRDSTALLHCTVRQAAALGIEVFALHVHHGLQAQADAWWVQVQTQARRWGAGFAAQRLTGAPGRGESVEAWARRERYRALADMAQRCGCTAVLLAHHRRDQAETWLLQALRGAGAAGLASMPAVAQRQGLSWARPWLDMPREAIEAYVSRHRLRYADDTSNDDPRFARNRLRLQVWPALQRAFPELETSLAAAAGHAQHARALAAEVAEMDLPTVQVGADLSLSAWSTLPPARRVNALRAWLQKTLDQVPESLVQRLCLELPRGSTGRWPAAAGELRLYRARLGWRAAPAVQTPLTLPEPSKAERVLSLAQPGCCRVPAWGGCFEVTAAAAAGVTADLLRRVTLRARSGGERFALAPRATPRSLKKQFQSLGVPSHLREGPLLWGADGQLIYVPGLGINARHWAEPGAAALSVRWVPDL